MLEWIPSPWLVRSRLFVPEMWLYPDDRGIRIGWRAAPGASLKDLESVTLRGHSTLADRGVTDKAYSILAVPANQAIIKDLRFPAAVRARLDDVLRFELDRHTPFSAQTAFFGYRELPGIDPGTIGIRLVAVPRKLIKNLLDQLDDVGVTPSRIVVQAIPDDATGIPLIGYRASAPKQPRHALWALSVTAILVGAIVMVPLLTKRGAVLEQQQRLESILPEATAVADLDRERETLLERLNRPVYLGEGRKRAIDLLKDLTETIPEQGYLTSLRVENVEELRLEGEITTATSLIEPLEELPALTNVRFLAPTSRVPDQRERFQIGARILAPEKPRP